MVVEGARRCERRPACAIGPTCAVQGLTSGQVTQTPPTFSATPGSSVWDSWSHASFSAARAAALDFGGALACVSCVSVGRVPCPCLCSLPARALVPVGAFGSVWEPATCGSPAEAALLPVCTQAQAAPAPTFFAPALAEGGALVGGVAFFDLADFASLAAAASATAAASVAPAAEAVRV